LRDTTVESGIAVPSTWSEEQLLKRHGQFMTRESVTRHLECVRNEGNLDVYHDRRTGQELYVGRAPDLPKHPTFEREVR
jgi:hypothetical protein